jgi:hypothetical protein
MREILPEAAPGQTLEELSGAQLLQMIVVRHTERVLHETRLAGGFISDGSSLQEWIYAQVRVTVGINPNASVHLSDLESVERTPEIMVFDEVVTELGKALKRHVQNSFDAFVHLRNELPLAADGHRPVNERFRRLSDEKLLATLDEVHLPHHVVSGSVTERLVHIAELFDLEPVCSAGEAKRLALEEYAQLDVRAETERPAQPQAATVGGRL